MAAITWKGTKQLFSMAFKGFGDHKLTKLSGSLAYSTVFSMGPLLIVLISICSLVWGQQAAAGKIYGQLASLTGAVTAEQLQNLIKNATLNGKSNFALIAGLVTLFIGATAVFSEIQDSINSIWGLKSKPKKGWLKMLQNRFLSFSIVVVLGFLLLISLTVTSLIDGFADSFKQHFHAGALVVFYIINNLLTLIIATVIFAVIFKVLPDGLIRWKDIFAGALFTAIFFMVGKFVISLYISKSNIGSTYGAAGSLIVLLLWIYYSSLILYSGAEITRAYAEVYGAKVKPKDYAVSTRIVELEKDGSKIKTEA